MFYEDNDETVPLLRKNIAWDSDKKELFINPPGDTLEEGEWKHIKSIYVNHDAVSPSSPLSSTGADINKQLQLNIICEWKQKPQPVRCYVLQQR